MHDNSYANSISSFVRWANERISKEIESNEKCEEACGTSVIHKAQSRVSYLLSESEKIDIIDRIDSMRDEDDYSHLNFKAICKIAGIHDQTYYKWRKLLKLGNYKK